MLKPVLVAATLALLLPSVAHAEFRKSQGDVRAAVAVTTATMNAVLTVDGMLDKINSSYMTGLRRCYNKGLAHDPTLKGKVTLSFTISSYGHVAGEATGIDAAVAGCVANQMRMWKFGRPVDRRETGYRISLQLSR